MTQLTNPYLKGFRAWLIDQGSPERSAYSFVYAVSCVNEEYFKPLLEGKDMFEALPDAIASGTAVNWLTSLEGFITHDIEKTIDRETKNILDVTKRKHLQDMRCKLRKFKKYVEGLQNDYKRNNDGENETGSVINSYIPDNMQYYTRDNLRKIFRLRILHLNITSGSQGTLYPISVIHRLFIASRKEENIEILAKLGIRDFSGNVPSLRKQFNEWAKKLTDNIVFHTINKAYALSDIDGLLIDSDTAQAFIKVGNKRIVLMSKTPDGKKVPMEAKSLRHIHLNYSKGTRDILNDLSKVLPTMKRLTSILRKTAKGEKQESGLKKYDIKFEDVAPLLPLLLVELNYIAAATEIAVISYKINF